MYKVFFNESFLKITKGQNNAKDLNPANQLLQNVEELVDWVLTAEHAEKPLNLIYYSCEPDKIWDLFISRYKIVEAAGGLVKNKNNQYLFIFRRGKWDLPKGKIDNGESPTEAAVREVKEETGLAEVKIERELTVTHHIYRLKGKLVLKPTHWYLMINEGKDNLIPQTEEDIEKAEWLNSQELGLIHSNTFGNIKDVLLHL
jgi:8-oxo-dGTP pyrophosphatase MutT (NUDIX family)